jgi:class 3 adenylate cyclase
MSWLSMFEGLHNLPARVLASRFLFSLLVLQTLIIMIACLVPALAWIDKPFPGFLVNQRMVINGMGQYHWTGTQRGLKHPDKILEANGRPIQSSAQLHAVVSDAPVGTPIEYSVERAGERITISVESMTFTLGDLLVIFGSLFLVGLIYLVIGVVVFVMKPDTPVSWSFFLLCCFLSQFNVMAFDVAATHRGFVRWYFVANGLFAAAGVHLGMLFPQPRAFVTRHPVLQFVPYVAALVILIPVEWFYPGPVFLQAYNLLYLMILAGTISVVAASLASFLRHTSVLARQRAKVVLFGAAVGWPIPAIGELAFFKGWTFLGMPIQANFLTFPLVMFPAAIAYAITKHNLFDVDVYIKRTVGYVLMTMVVAGGYFVLQSTVKAAVLDPLLGQSAEKVYPFLFALLTVFAFNPVSHAVQESVDRLFFRKAFDYKATVTTLSESLTSIIDVQAFFEQVIQTVRKDLYVDRAGVVLLDERTNTCQSLFRGTKFGADQDQSGSETDPCLLPQDPLLSLLAGERKLITKYDVAEDPRYTGVRDQCGRRFEDLGASVAVPLFYHDQFAGVLALGYKQSGHFYTREDIDLVKTLSSMTSTAIEQSREKGQKVVLMQLFSKHVSPQVAESLWEQREQFLEGGRPKSQSMIVTAMFTDLQGFSTLSEKQSPEALMGWLNTYLEMMTTTVMEHGGVVDDFFGDGVKINFGVPIPRETEEAIRDDADRAVTCALDMGCKMVALNEKMTAQGQQPLRMRIGIHTGPVVAGSLGSAERMKYTTIGDTVNTAARLESFDKDLVLPRPTESPCRILMSEATLRLVEGLFDVEKVGELSLKGKAQSIGAYWVVGDLSGDVAAASQRMTIRGGESVA